MWKTIIKRIAVAAGVLLISTHNTAVAIGFDDVFYSGNDILFYDPQATDCDSSLNIPGSTNEEKVWNYFISKGLSTQQVAGVMGNISIESGGTYDPEIIQGGGKESDPSGVSSGWGIIQWTPGSKIIGLLDDAGISTPPNELKTQLDLVWWHMGNTSPTGARNMLAHYKTIDTISGATEDFMNKMEAPGIPHLPERIGEANLAYGKYSGGSVSAITGGSSSSCADLGDIVAIARGELGNREDPIGCDADNSSVAGDCGEAVNKYTDNHLEFWCADFVSWVYNQAGKPFTGGDSGGWRIASVSSVKAWFQENGTYTQNGPGVTPKPGDVYITRGENHTGIVEKVEGGKIYTISGNTLPSDGSSANGIAVGSGIFSIGSSYFDGFGSLN